jgi:outer membrane protein assembly factor BamB
LAWAAPLRGVGRVPLVVGDRIYVITYSDPTRTYEWSCFGLEGDQQWRASLPAGGYASLLHDRERDVLLGPIDYNGFAELDAVDGRVRWTQAFPGAVRSTPALHEGAYVAAVGNRLVRFADGRSLAEVQLDGHLFFGETTIDSGAGYALAVVASPEPHTVAVSFDPVTLTERWRARIGPDYLISSDTSGVSTHAERGMVLANGADQTVTALDMSTGARIWQTSLAAEELPVTNWRGCPVVTETNVLVGTIEGELFALDLADGQLAWRRDVDELGIWSPPLATSRGAVVHGGLHLYGLSHTGETEWVSPVGFGSYSRPVSCGDRVLVCGGDPPLDGYLVAVDPGTLEPPPMVAESTYDEGEHFDALALTLRAREPVTDVRIDLRAFGLSADERLVRAADGGFHWSGRVAANKRLGEMVVFGSAELSASAARRQFALRIVCDSSEPSDAAARVLEAEELPGAQTDRVSSGPAVVSALAASLGKSIDQAEAAQAARSMIDRHGVPPVHSWRGGAGRIFMADRLPLREDEGRVPTAEDVERAIDRWQSQH